MKLRFTVPAARSLEKTLDELAFHSPQGVRHVQARIQAVIDLVLRFPKAGQNTGRTGGCAVS